ncbi:MAG: SRPBCC family protein [Imperialibacter sp.]|uniref:SRPBCC family protein n=1 Tax=Imperialibacter sp. TaxID=2038411 RepID=UPI0032EC06CC
MSDMLNPGKLTNESDGYKVVFERELPFSSEAVWEAITNPDKLATWFMVTEMEFKPGGKMIIRFPEPDNSESFGKITRIVPNKQFEYYWEEELVIWELQEQGSDRCLLTLTHSKVDGQWAKSVPAGWHFMLDTLEEILAGNKLTTNTPDRQETLKAQYAEMYKHL